MDEIDSSGAAWIRRTGRLPVRLPRILTRDLWPGRESWMKARCLEAAGGGLRGGEHLFESFRAYAMRGDSTAEEAIAHIRSFIEGGKPVGRSDPEGRAKAPVPPGFFAASPDQRKSPEAAPSGPGPGRRLLLQTCRR